MAACWALSPPSAHSDTANDDGIRLPITSVSDMQVAQDDSNNNSDSMSDTSSSTGAADNSITIRATNPATLSQPMRPEINPPTST